MSDEYYNVVIVTKYGSYPFRATMQGLNDLAEEIIQAKSSGNSKSIVKPGVLWLLDVNDVRGIYVQTVNEQVATDPEYIELHKKWMQANIKALNKQEKIGDEADWWKGEDGDSD